MKDWEKKNKLWVQIRPMCIILHQAAFVFSAADLVPVNKIAIFVAKCWSYAGCCLHVLNTLSSQLVLAMMLFPPLDTKPFSSFAH